MAQHADQGSQSRCTRLAPTPRVAATAKGLAGGLLWCVVAWCSAACGPVAPRAARLDPALSDESEVVLTSSAPQCAGSDGVARCTAACDADDLRACEAMAVVLLAGDGVEADPAKARQAFAKACAGARWRACAYDGLLALNGVGGQADPSVAKARFEQACSNGEALGCHYQGKLFQEGLGVPADSARAAQLYDAACAGGEPEACFDRGILHLSAGNPHEAAAAFEQACARKALKGCTALGTLVASDAVGAPDLTRAARLYRQACEGGEPQGCYYAGFFYSTGKGVAADPDAARAYLGRACAGGHAKACKALGR